MIRIATFDWSNDHWVGVPVQLHPNSSATTSGPIPTLLLVNY